MLAVENCERLSMGSEITLLVMLLSLQSSTTDGVQIPVQVVPRGIESVNGSSVNMGCTEELTITDGFTTCGSPGNGAIIYLIDGSSPNYIDTSAPDWASRLVVVRRNESYPSDSIVLSFGFDTDVSPSAVEIDLFLCSEWTFWVTKISLYANEQFDLAFTGILHLGSFLYPLESFCGSLSTITLTSWLPSSYQTFHIVMNFAYDPFIEYVNIGEVRFNGINFEDPSPSSATTSPGPSATATVLKDGGYYNIVMKPTSLPEDKSSSVSAESLLLIAPLAMALSLLTLF